ncbi:MAG: PAS domain-containing sensor histidine kinase [Deltaproteobacteria bacterium]|nr:PAS domain-containing sensor histidine kinase [Deltaproteobacteria bacterium]
MPDREPERPVEGSLLDALEEGVVDLRDGRILTANAAFAGWVGVPAPDLAGRDPIDFFTDSEGRALGADAMGEACRLRQGDGGLRPVSVRPIGGDRVLVVDRLRERRLESEVWQLSSRLGTGAEASATPPLCDEVAGMVEHEIRTASTVIRGYLRLLLDGRAGPLQAEQREFLDEARRETRRIQGLVDDLLELASSEGSRELRIVRKPACLHAVVHQALATARPLLESRELELALDLDLEDDAVRIDEERIASVLVNVLANAAKFSPRGGTVRLATHLVESAVGASISISVLDEGAGVSHEDVERIFDPFVRGRGVGGEDGRPPVEGMGLGLALCRRVLEAHGGAITTIPGLGYGLFRVTLPVEG